MDYFVTAALLFRQTFYLHTISLSVALNPSITSLCQSLRIPALYPNLSTLLHTSLSLSLNPSVTADLRPLSAGPLLVAPSWRAVDRLGRGRRQCQLYWCRKGHTRQTGPVSEAAASYPPGCHVHNTHICPHFPYIAATQTHAHQHQRTIAKQVWSDWDLVNWDKTFVYTLGQCKQAHGRIHMAGDVEFYSHKEKLFLWR